MRRLLILGLYYPPANFMAGRRLEGWARHLPAFGYQPRVLTRFYDPDERHTHDVYASSRPTQTLAEPWIQDERVVYTRFHQHLWGRIPLPGKIRGLGHYAWPDPDHSGWLRECRDYLAQAESRPDLIIASHGPAGVFRVARKLSEWLDVPWVADFRDLWVREQWTGLDKRLKIFFQRRHLRSAAGITVATEGMAEAIRAQLAPLTTMVKPIYNGAEPVQHFAPDPEDREVAQTYRDITTRHRIVLTYTGQLYAGQRVERFLNAVGEFIRQTGRSCAVVLCGAHKRADYVKWSFVHILGPVHHATALFFQRESTALFYPTWPATDSVYSGKIFELALSGRPVFVAFTPSPDLEALCKRLKSTIVIKNAEELVERLTVLDGHEVDNTEAPAIATKKYWAGELAAFFNEILDGKTSSNISER